MARAGRPPTDPDKRINRHEMKYPWNVATGEGWQHGDIPEPPDGLRAESIDAWQAWFTGWWASFYEPQDVPQLRLAIAEFDSVVRGAKPLGQILTTLDRWGITEKGRQDNRWQRAKTAKPAAASNSSAGRAKLKVV